MKPFEKWWLSIHISGCNVYQQHCEDGELVLLKYVWHLWELLCVSDGEIRGYFNISDTDGGEEEKFLSDVTVYEQWVSVISRLKSPHLRKQ